MIKKRLYSLLVLCFGLAVLMVSCNSKTKEKNSSNTKTAESEEQRSKQDTITINLKSNDKMQFDKDEIVVYDGQTVVLKLEHTGEMPKSSMGHNFVLLDNSVSISDYAKKAGKAKENDFIPEESGLTLAHTKMIGGGDHTEITFEAPEVGGYDFICSFPGHYANMKGEFIVK